MAQPTKVKRRVENGSTAKITVATMAGTVLKFSGRLSQWIEVVPGWVEFYYHASGAKDAVVKLEADGTDLAVNRSLTEKGSVHKAFKFRVYKDPQ